MGVKAEIEYSTIPNIIIMNEKRRSLDSRYSYRGPLVPNGDNEGNNRLSDVNLDIGPGENLTVVLNVYVTHL